MQCVGRIIARSRDGQNGQTMVEYAVVLAVITAAIVSTIALLAATSNGMIELVIDVLT